MKRCLFILCCLCLCLCACGSPDGPTEPSAETTVPSVQTTAPPEPTFPESTLDEETLSSLEAIFDYGCYKNNDLNWYGRALTSYYTRPEEMDLFQLFFNLCGDWDETTLTAEEQKLLADNVGDHWSNFDIGRMTTGEMDMVLRTYFGISLENANQATLDGFFYCEETDAYLEGNNSTNAIVIELLGGRTLDDGSIELFYQDRNNPGSKQGIVTLYLQDGRWMIRSNVPLV